MSYQSQCICVHARQIARSVTRVYDEALAPSGLTLAQYALLRAVERNEPAPIGTLADELDLDRTTLARNLRPLERDGLLATAVSKADRRVTQARLSARGRQVLALAVPLWRVAQAHIEARIGGRRARMLRELARALPDALREPAVAAAPAVRKPAALKPAPLKRAASG